MRGYYRGWEPAQACGMRTLHKFGPILRLSVAAGQKASQGEAPDSLNPNVQDRAILTAAVETGLQRSLALYGLPGEHYTIEYTPFLSGPWFPLFDYIQTNAVINIIVTSPNDVIFYRLSGPF